MAKKKTSSRTPAKSAEVAADAAVQAAESVVPETDTVEDAQVIEETPAAVETDPDPETTKSDADDSIEAGEANTVEDATPTHDAQTTVVQRKGGFFPMVLGGLVAGGIGYGAATYLPEYLEPDAPDPLAALSSAQSELQSDVATLTSDVETLASAPSVPDLTSDLAAVSGQLAGVSDQLSDLQSAAVENADRILVLEKRPLTEVVAPEAIEAYNAELQSLRDAVAAQLADVTTVADTARAEIAAAKEQAAALEQSAVDAARAGAAQSALNSISASLAAGGGYQDTLGVLAENSDIEIPAVLMENATDGVPSQAALQEQFPDLARVALSQARATAPAEEGESGLGAFFKSQLNVRSLSPQEGSGPDAVLSRAEAAVKTGDIGAALEEIAALPESAKNILAPWVSQANTRANAQRAAADLATQLSTN
ncbi:MAG: mitofilin family membrane protein [Pseudomonadota bacterium]